MHNQVALSSAGELNETVITIGTHTRGDVLIAKAAINSTMNFFFILILISH